MLTAPWSSPRHDIQFIAAGFAIVALFAGVAFAQVPSGTEKSSFAAVAPRTKATPDWVLAAQKKNVSAIDVPAPNAASPTGFEQNLGQFEGDAGYIARIDLGVVLLRPGAMTTVIAPPEALASAVNVRPKSKQPPRPLAKPRVVDLTFTGANAKAEVRSQDLLPTRIGYFSGRDPKNWLHAVPTFRTIRYEQLYPDIDLVVYRRPEGVTYDFVVAPGGSASSIRMSVGGADKVNIDAAGDLVIHAGDARLLHHKPFVYQTGEGVRKKIDGGFEVEGNVVTFKVGDYDHSMPLVIDPTVTEVFSNSLSGAPIGHAHGNAVAVASNGDILFAGSANVFSSTGSFSKDAFVTWLDSNGTQIFTAYFSGSKTCANTPNICDDDDVALALAVAPSGEIAVTGSTQSIDFFTTSDAFDQFCGIDKLCGRGVSLVNPVHHHTFLVELVQTTVPVQMGNTVILVSGLSPTWGSFFNVEADDQGTGVAFDGNGTIYVAGFGVFSRNLTLKSSGYLAAFKPAAASKLVFQSTLGNANGNGNVFANAVAIDRVVNRAYVAGSAAPVSPSDFPARDPSFTTATGGGSEAFVAAFDTSGNPLNTTLLRGSLGDVATGVAVDPAGSVYVSGTTSSANFNGAGSATSGGSDAFVAKLHYRLGKRGALFSNLDYATLLGGSNEDRGTAIAVDAVGRAYVTGLTRSSNFPTLGPAVTPLRTSIAPGSCGTQMVQCPDAFLTRLTASGALDFSVLFGGSSWDAGSAVALRNTGDAVVAGESFISTASIPHFDATITRIKAGPDLAVAQSCTPNQVDAGHVLTCTMTVTNNGLDPVSNLVLLDQLSPPAWNEPLIVGSAPCQTFLDAVGLIDRVQCRIAVLAPGASRSFSYPFIPAVPGPFSSSASVAFLDDPDPSNNSANVTTPVIASADLTAYASHWPDPTPLGSMTNIDLWVGNQGHDLAGATQIRLNIPGGLEIISVTTPGFCNPASGMGPMTMTCDVGYLVPNNALPGNEIQPPAYPGYLSGSEAVGVRVVALAHSAGTFASTARVSGAITDPALANDRTIDQITVIAGEPKIGARIVPIRRTATPGGVQIDMEMEFRNSGDGNAYAVQLTDLVAVNVVGAGTATPIGTLPAVVFPFLGVGNARSYLPSFQVASGLVAFDVDFRGVSNDTSGNAIPFRGQAHIVP